MKPFAITLLSLIFGVSMTYAQNKEKKQENKSINLDLTTKTNNNLLASSEIQPVELKDAGNQVNVLKPVGAIKTVDNFNLRLIPNAYSNRSGKDDSVILQKKLDPQSSVKMPGTEKLNQPARKVDTLKVLPLNASKK
ncbi:hypothetical protein [Sphingobacterium kyonggiense]